MFTGIIETIGRVSNLKRDQDNLEIIIESDLSNELKIDQSVAHNGVCLTVVAVTEGTHTVTAISETLNKSNLGKLKEGDLLNLERCMQMNGRLDGHIVQGHVDQTGICTEVIEKNGSWEYTISYDPAIGNITVEKGSICVNGISLTVINSKENSFSVAIIPYTYEHTNMKSLKIGDTVNLEFDIIGKYVARLTRQKI
ncbi:MAG: riboflavin synthase [Sphingobacteriales bacterium 17-39-43]|uniref:riboflavin synthase n=1 Tax=Daejeonella sp. TaxID=2805397 RepID=UPI000BCA8A84|nr:riboflavin synthase [Daejeonella sp.]MCF8452319.1 riboflavin synthase [Pedobacter sp.]OYZ30488.1 MAG: riboflavin synthase [Sphingobacteriales bacterium 16-39-50]OYZ48577.1 MAG: riboflavin synthase [Sphingobacteriales bacterium 24-40-4]OZA23135.1 MAG: riboflavin synthase [Sphingobacteriales bacterium 17-39-43]OZA53315.1 MAG: riboflavin synthase [Sphingobacteriales bacterium 39-40-5]